MISDVKNVCIKGICFVDIFLASLLFSGLIEKNPYNKNYRRIFKNFRKKIAAMEEGDVNERKT